MTPCHCSKNSYKINKYAYLVVLVKIPCSLVEKYQTFQETYRNPVALKSMVHVSTEFQSSPTSLHFAMTQNPRIMNLKQLHRLKFRMFNFLLPLSADLLFDLLFFPEDGSGVFLRNIVLASHYTTIQPT
jgi:hypothetical protein